MKPFPELNFPSVPLAFARGKQTGVNLTTYLIRTNLIINNLDFAGKLGSLPIWFISSCGIGNRPVG